MSIIQTFYDNLATQYDKLFFDWQATTKEQAEILNKIFKNNGFDYTAKILDCACLELAIKSIINQIDNNGIFVASIRDYDSLLMEKPPYSPPYIHKTDKGQRVSFQI